MKKRNLSMPLSTNKHLLRWVEKMVELCKPDAIHWIDGSKEEYDQLCAEMVTGGTFIKLNQKKWPGCYLARSDASDVARSSAPSPKKPPVRLTTGSIPSRCVKRSRASSTAV